jgi:hypothetical protein
MKRSTRPSAPETDLLAPTAGLLSLLMLMLVLAPGPAEARPKPHLKELDLDARPGDVKLQKKPWRVRLRDEAGFAGGLPIDPNALAQTDQMERSEIPKRRGESGTSSGEGSVLEQLLEDHTIPLFRLRMDSPL